MKYEVRKIERDLIVAGGGVPGIVTAIQAARLGLTVAIINDRGYLGGNSSSEMYVQLGGSNNALEFNFYARETGIVEEIRLENLYRNLNYNPYIWDTVLFDFVLNEKNIQLFMNTNIDEVQTNKSGGIQYIAGSQLDSEIRFEFYGRFFVDDTGDGTVGYLAGAEYRIGREGKDEFGEHIAPDKADSLVLPSTLFFIAKDVGKPIKYYPPKFALDMNKSGLIKNRLIPKHNFHISQWYYELGGELDQIKDIEEITQKQRALIYGIWDYIKNSGEYESDNYDLEYVSCVVGKRESRRLIGDYILNESDIANQKDFIDVVGHGGWNIDLHNSYGVFSQEPTSTHYYHNGIYQIPYRTCYSKNINNLFMVGRCMSVTHIALGTTRVIATLCMLAQAVGAAAYLCTKKDTTPRGVYENYINDLQQFLIKNDQRIIGVKNNDKNNLAQKADISVSSYKKCLFDRIDNMVSLNKKIGVSLPVKKYLGSVSFMVKSKKETKINYRVYLPNKKESYCPQVLIYTGEVNIDASNEFVWLRLPVNIPIDRYFVFLELDSCEGVQLAITEERVTGIMCLERNMNNCELIYDVNTFQMKKNFWNKLPFIPCLKLSEGEDIYSGDNLTNGFSAPYGLPNLWLSDDKVENENIVIKFPEPVKVNELILRFDTNLDIQIPHDSILNQKTTQTKKNVIPEVVRDYDVYYNCGSGYILHNQVVGNYQRANKIHFNNIKASEIKIVFRKTNGSPRIGLYEVEVY